MREALEEHPRGGKQVLLVSERALVEAQQMRETRLHEAALLGIRDVLVDRRAQLVPCRRRVLVLEDSGPTANHFAESPECDAVSVGEATTGMPPDVAHEAVDVLLELPTETGLADAADADDGDEMCPVVLGRAVVQLLDQT